MSNDPNPPSAIPGDTSQWPRLKMTYRTDPTNIAALVPPGLEPAGNGLVYLSVYNFPVKGEPEHGISTKVDASYEGTPGQYSLGMGIDQESAVFISLETNGQPKFPCEITYFRLGDYVEARCTHQRYTFLEFQGQVTGNLPVSGEDNTDVEWWTKYSRAVGGHEKQYDFEPHVVRVQSTMQDLSKQGVEGTLTLRDSPWDPYTELLPMEDFIESYLVWPQPKARDISIAGALDPIAFWPYADTIGGSRWPGDRGGPRNTGRS